MEALKKEVAWLGARAGRPLRTLYLGGGTPSLVPEEDLVSLFVVLDTFFPRLPGAEVTLEANPDDVTPAKAALWRKLGINRVSLGVQSFADEILELLGRRHDSHQAERALTTLLAAGFVVSCDLMLGLPRLSADLLYATLKRLVRLGPQHISVYLLEMDKPHRLVALAQRRPDLFPSDEEAARQYVATSAFLRNKGYCHYEVSNFALPAFLARHNLRYWLGGVVLACGVAAAGQGRRSRWGNTENLMAYLEAVEQSRWPRAWQYRLSEEQAKAEKLMLRLRLARGAPMQLVTDIACARPAFAQRTEDFISAGLARVSKQRLQLSPGGWLLSNELFATLV